MFYTVNPWKSRVHESQKKKPAAATREHCKLLPIHVNVYNNCAYNPYFTAATNYLSASVNGNSLSSQEKELSSSASKIQPRRNIKLQRVRN